jgi:HSP20 family molecular chaperone IbpA
VKQVKKKSKKKVEGNNKGKKYNERISLCPLSMEEAISLVMKVDPKKVRAEMKKGV